MMERNRAIEPEISQEVNLTFKLERVHFSIIKEAKKNHDIFDPVRYKEKIREDYPGDVKRQNQMLTWNQTTLNNMVEAGYLIRDGRQYRMNPEVNTFMQREEWKPKKNHIKLLKKNENGIIRSTDLKQEHDLKNEYEAKRQKKMIDSMITSLSKNGYLDRIGRGEYKLTEKAQRFLDGEGKTILDPMLKKEKTLSDSSKITYFDRHLKDVLTEDGTIDPEKLLKHEKAESLKKRILTLEHAGLIKDKKPTVDLIIKIDKVIDWVKDRELTIEKLTKEQTALIADMRIFLNLSFTQISKYIYDGGKELASTDISYLVQKKVLKKDPDLGIYVLDIAGIKLSNEMLAGQDAVRYKTKLESRKEEVVHDMLVYTAYKEFSKELHEKGCTIVSIKNDRQMRREDAKAFGHMKDGYSDLRVEYKDPEKLSPIVHDIEIDCGYDGKTILSKLNKTAVGNKSAGSRSHKGSFGWYCNSVKQAVRVAKVLTQDKTQSRKITTRQIELFVIGKDGEVKKVRW